MKKFILNEKQKVIIILLIITLVHTVLRFYMGLRNIFFYVSFAISNLLVYKTCKSLFKDSLISLLACIFNAFSIVAIKNYNYNIIYELCNLFTLAITYFHIKIWRKNNFKVYKLFPIAALFALGSLTGYNFFIYSTILYLVFTLKYFKNKNYNNLLKYQLAILLSCIIFIVIDHFISVPQISFATKNIPEKFLNYILLINSDFLNKLFLLFIIIIGFICYRKKCKDLKFNSQMFLLVFPLAVYLLASMILAPCADLSYIIPIYSVFSISTFYITKKYTFEHLNNREFIFVLILLVTIFAYGSISPIIF